MAMPTAGHIARVLAFSKSSLVARWPTVVSNSLILNSRAWRPFSLSSFTAAVLDLPLRSVLATRLGKCEWWEPYQPAYSRSYRPA